MKSEEAAPSGTVETSGSMFTPPSIQPSEELVKEVAQLPKSLRPSVKMLGVKSVTPAGGHCRALLDGGATHVLRPARSKAEYDKAIPIKVELAACRCHNVETG